MPANVHQNSSIISNEFLRRLKNTLTFTMSINRQYSKLYQTNGTKPGVTVNLRKPVYLSGRRGQRATPEGLQNNLVPLTINTQYGQDVAISSQEEALNLQDYGEQVMQPAIDIIANMIDADGLALYKEVSQFTGTPGVTPNSRTTYINAGTILSNAAVPTGKKRYAVVNPLMEGALLDSMATQFNPNSDVAEMNRNGVIGRAWGLNFGMDQNIATHTVGALGGTPVVNVSGGVAEGATSVAFDGATASVTGYLKEGDSITFASCNSVNPSSKVNTGSLKQWSIAADVDTNGSGQGTIYLREAIKATGPNRNVVSRPADNAAILVFGSATAYAGLQTQQALVYHPDFITFATVDLYVPRNVEMGSRAQSDDLNLSVRHIRFFDGREDQLIDRFDVLGGWKVLRPEMATRVLGAGQ